MKEKEARSLFDDSSVRAFLGANRAKGGLGSVGEVLNSFLEAEWRRGGARKSKREQGGKKRGGRVRRFSSCLFCQHLCAEHDGAREGGGKVKE